jgi:hypothetical protein
MATDMFNHLVNAGRLSFEFPSGDIARVHANADGERMFGNGPVNDSFGYRYFMVKMPSSGVNVFIEQSLKDGTEVRCISMDAAGAFENWRAEDRAHVLSQLFPDGNKPDAVNIACETHQQSCRW